MTNTTDTLKQGLESLKAQEAQLLAELEKVRAVLTAMEKAIEGVPMKAPHGSLKSAILGVVGSSPMSRAEIIEALKESGYTHSLDSDLVSKTLTFLYRAKKLSRVGVRVSTKYLLKKGA